MQPSAGSRLYRAAASFPAPCSAGRPVLQNYTARSKLIADQISGCEVAALLGGHALSNTVLDVARVGIALEPVGGRSGKKSQHICALLQHTALERRQPRESEWGVEIVTERLEHPFVHIA